MTTIVEYPLPDGLLAVKRFDCRRINILKHYQRPIYNKVKHSCAIISSPEEYPYSDSLLSKTPLDRRLIKLLKRRQEALDEQLHYPCILITTVAEDPLLQYCALCKTY